MRASHRSWLLRTPWPLLVGVLLPVWLLIQRQVFRGLRLGVLDRGVMELWVHGRQPGWLDWVPFIHPPGYSVFMNTVDTLAGGSAGRAAELIFGIGAVCSVGTALLAAAVGHRRFGPMAGLALGGLLLFSPQVLRPFEHYPLARLLLFAAFVVVTAARTSVGARVAACFAAVEVHLSSWFLLGPLLFFDSLFGEDRKRDRTVLGGLLAAFLVTTAFGLLDVLEFGGGEKEGVGEATLEWANPLLLALLLPVAAVGDRWRRAAACLVYVVVMLALQALQIADGAPFPWSLHYFELVGPPAALVVVGALLERRTMLGKVALGVLVLSQLALFVRGLLVLFVQPRWLLMAG